MYTGRQREDYQSIGYDEDDLSLHTLPTPNDDASTGGETKGMTRKYSVSFAEHVHKHQPKRIEKTIPRDYYSLARIMFLLMGSGILVPAICFQLSVDWFGIIFPHYDEIQFFNFLEYILSFGFNIGQLLSMVIYTIFMWRKSVHTLKAQTFTVEQFIFVGYLLNFICMVCALFINVILVSQYGFSDNSETYDKIFMMVCLNVLNCIVGVGKLTPCLFS